MERSEIEAVIRQAAVCRLGMADEQGPYVVPMSFGYEDGVLYFHGKGSGRKIDALRANPNVCFEIDVDVALKPSEKACRTSISYRSVIGFGKAFFIEGDEEKRKAFGVLMRQYVDGDFEFAQESVERTTVFGVRIESMTGKVHGF